MAQTGWTTTDMPDLDGGTVIVTGANSGIGLEAARAFAAHGAHVVLAVRDTAKGRSAAATVTGSVEVRELDLADLASVRRFADDWSGDIRLLVNNAGVMAPPLMRTADGFELQFGTNHLGHFALTAALIEHVTDRVVTVSSLAHRAGRIDFVDPNWHDRKYQRWAAYGQSKLANLLFTLELQARLTHAGSRVIATAAHPGFSATNLQGRFDSGLAAKVTALGNRVFAQDAASGALPTLFAATASVRPGAYVGPSGVGQSRGAPRVVGSTTAAEDSDVARRLWTMSEELTGVTARV
ncbi:oxidoreductase [Marisediminicola sp. LYQ134]|uniref:oxidoreductase n=1 Tax=Marisediminicola sp. LYQ134 TaxID=3391061 RepID=UPI00398373D1